MNEPTKRPREDEQNGIVDEDDDDEPLLAPRKAHRKVVPGEQCPFLDTISRQARCVAQDDLLTLIWH